jgi:hypothetical protein
MKPLCQNARLVSPAHIVKDWSYRAQSFAGSNYLLVGDAACFIDPILSSGCFLAMHGGYIGAICLNTILKQKQAEPKLFLDFYCQTYNRLFDSFLDMAYFWYGGHRSTEALFWQAKKKMVNPAWNVHARRAFIYLAAGFSGNQALQQIAGRDSAGFSSHELPILYREMGYGPGDLTVESLPFPCKNFCDLYEAQSADLPLHELQDTMMLRIVRGVRIEDTMVERSFQWYNAVKVISNGEVAAILDYFPEGCVLEEEYKALLNLLHDSKSLKSVKETLLGRDLRLSNNNLLKMDSDSISSMLAKVLKLGIIEVVK